MCCESGLLFILGLTMHIKDALLELWNQLGISGLSLDESGFCRLIIDRQLMVDIEQAEGEGELHLHSALGSLPAGRREALYATLLAANLFGSETGGAVLALDETAGEIVLFRSLRMVEMDYPTFVSTLEGFIQQVEIWKNRLNEPVQTAVPDNGIETSVAEFSGNFFIRA